MKTPEQKAKQAEAHRKWRLSDKGKAWYQKQKEKPEAAPAVSPTPWPFPEQK